MPESTPHCLHHFTASTKRNGRPLRYQVIVMRKHKRTVYDAMPDDCRRNLRKLSLMWFMVAQHKSLSWVPNYGRIGSSFGALDCWHNEHPTKLSVVWLHVRVLRLKRFYTEHNPAQVAQAGTLTSKYWTKHNILFRSLYHKYSVDRDPLEVRSAELHKLQTCRFFSLVAWLMSSLSWSL